MIVDEKIEVKITKKNIEYYSNFYKVNLGDIILVNISNELMKGSNKKINVKCDICHVDRYISFQSYNNNLKSCNEYPIYTCDKCSHIKIKEFNKKKYGVEYYSQTEEYNTKFKNTMLQRYGVEYSMQNEDLKEKAKKTNIKKFGVENPFIDNDRIRSKFNEKYGVDHPSKVYEFKSKIKKTMLKKYGVEYAMQSSEIKNKVLKTNLLKYGGHPMKNDLIRYDNCIISRDRDYISYLEENKSLFKCHLGHNFEITSDTYHNRIRLQIPICTICNPVNSSSSIKEVEVLSFIKSIYVGEIIQSYRDVFEIDIYLPQIKLGFEFNGLYWHSDEYKEKSYHLDKSKHFEKLGIRIVHIWEDDWINRTNIIKSMIQNILQLNNSRIPGRKCRVVKLENQKYIEFVNENHLQGADKSTIKIGLLHDNILVAAMSFNMFEGRKKMSEGEWNLSRFCTKLNLNVMGGASKLLSYFVKNYKPSRIISYADRDWSTGDLYRKTGFKLVCETKPDYKYIIGNSRIHKSRFRKSRLGKSESIYMSQNNIRKIWDSGKIKFEIFIKG